MKNDNVVHVHLHLENSDFLQGFVEKLLNLTNIGDKIMSAISEFAKKQTEYNDKLSASLEGISGDIKSLKDLIQKLQDSAGKITPEDQATLDALEKKSKELSDKFSAVDDLTPPEVPSS